MENINVNPFGDLPQALVEEMLSKSQEVGDALLHVSREVQSKKAVFRKNLEDHKLLRRDSEFAVVLPPTTCGVDGACAKEELLSVDILAAAAVALEGLTPPSEKRYREDPHHHAYVKNEKHDAETYTILRGIMIGMEQILAQKAPHDVIFIDGSLTTPLIFLNQAIGKASVSRNTDMAVSKKLFEILPEALKAYQEVLASTRTDKSWVAMPKYTTHREIGIQLGWDQSYDDRALLTFLLNPGELTKPIEFEQPDEPWHLTYEPCEKEIEAIKNSLTKLRIIYYKPHDWVPALRIEMGPSIASNDYQVATILQAIKYQCSSPSIFEPYPLFIADRMVKSLGGALPTFRSVVTRQMAENYEGDMGEIFLSMHGYRTEKIK
jgi:hypothetical protein